ncbi:nuclear transport factor 2 family protein [Hyalangium versicolor]|uniref:nuclear transport factor 2 family protein n=1 Tax=Hyalangium versicolor TaxID=2861190 RepID=UPI001CCEB57A|nr:nuclear transport factor 2 family protein [Hyalangium versicolor]
MRQQDLQYALDWIAIQQLAAEYGQAIDHGKDTDDWSRWSNVFTPEVTADYSRFMGSGIVTLKREQMQDVGRTALKAFKRVQHATATSVTIQFQSDTQAEVMAYAEVAHYFPLGGVPQEWTIIARYTFSVEKTAEGWRIRKVLLDPIHYRGNMLGLEFVQGKQLV